YRRSSITTMAGNAIRRPLPLLVSFSIVLPSLRDALATTESCPLSRSQINGTPAQGEDLAATHSAKRAQQNWNKYRRTPRRIDHLSGMLGVDGFHFLALYFGRLH